MRELDGRLGFGELIQQHLTDSRRGKNTQLPLADLLRQYVYSRLAGYEDLNDVERLSQDPTFRLIGSEKVWDRGVALTSRLQTFETEMLGEEDNFAGLARLNWALEAVSDTAGCIGKAEALDLIAYNLKPVAAAGPADRDRQLVADKLAATAGEDGRKAGETRSVLLAPPGAEPPDAVAVWGHPRQDRSVAISSRVDEPMSGSYFGNERGRRRQSVGTPVGKAAVYGCRGVGKGRTGGSRAGRVAQQSKPDRVLAFRGAQV